MPDQGYRWVKKDMRRGKLISTLNNGWYMLEFEDGKRGRFPPMMVTDQGPAPEEPKKEEPKKKAPAKKAGGDGGSDDDYKPPAKEADDDIEEYKMPLERQGSLSIYEYRIPAPSATPNKVAGWLVKMGFQKHAPDAVKNNVDGWALRYLQEVARTAKPQEFSQYCRAHFPKMMIGEVSSLGGRLLYKAGVTEWV